MPWSRFTKIDSYVNLLDSQTFTSSTTYTVPTNARLIVVECIGAGGGGGGGRSSPSSNNTAGAGGQGGAGGFYSRELLNASEVPSGAQTVTIGAGGTGGAGATEANGTAGGISGFGPIVFAGFGDGGKGHVTGDSYSTIPTAVSYGFSFTAGGQGGNSYFNFSGGPTVAQDGQRGLRGGGGGGGGGSGDSAIADANRRGADGGKSVTSFNDFYSGGSILRGGGAAGGAVGAINGNNGSNGTALNGGGGGGVGKSGIGGNGGNGGLGAGGGGGGCAGSGNAGSGGAGGSAQIKVWVYG